MKLHLRYVLLWLIVLLSIVIVGNFIGRDAIELRTTLGTQKQEQGIILEIEIQSVQEDNALLNGAETGIAQGIMTGVEGASFVECMRNMLIGVGVGFGISAFATFFVNLSSKLFRALGKKINALFNKADNVTSALDNKLDDAIPPAHKYKNAEVKGFKKGLLDVNPTMKGKIDLLPVEGNYMHNGTAITKADLYKHGNDIEWLKGVTGSKNGLNFELINGTPKFTNALSDVPLGSTDDVANMVSTSRGTIKSNARDIIMRDADDKLAIMLSDSPNSIPQIRDYFGADKVKGLSADDIGNFRSAQGFTWHEYVDEGGNYVTQLVPTNAHSSIGHSGGIADIKEMLKKLLGVA